MCVLVVNAEKYLWFGGSNLSDIRGKTFSLFAFTEIDWIYFLFLCELQELVFSEHVLSNR